MKTLILLPLFCLCTYASAQVDDIFLGNFLDIDPQRLRASDIKQRIPEIDTSRLFVWIGYCNAVDSALDRRMTTYLVDYFDLRLLATKDAVNIAGGKLEVGSPIYFVYKGKKYQTQVIEFIYLGCQPDTANIYASCAIPEDLRAEVTDQWYSWFSFQILCSTNPRIDVQRCMFDWERVVEDTVRAGEYTLVSHLSDTGRKGHYDETLYEAYVKVVLGSEIIFTTPTSEYPVNYCIGDFNGNGKIDLFVDYNDDYVDTHYVIIEFDGATYEIKEYVIENHD